MRTVLSHGVATSGAWLVTLGATGRLPVTWAPGAIVIIGGLTALLAALARTADVHLAPAWALPFAALIAAIAFGTMKYLTFRPDAMLVELAIPTLPLLIGFAIGERLVIARAR